MPSDDEFKAIKEGVEALQRADREFGEDLERLTTAVAGKLLDQKSRKESLIGAIEDMATRQDELAQRVGVVEHKIGALEKARSWMVSDTWSLKDLVRILVPLVSAVLISLGIGHTPIGE